jgi:hypothetical protein
MKKLLQYFEPKSTIFSSILKIITLAPEMVLPLMADVDSFDAAALHVATTSGRLDAGDKVFRDDEAGNSGASPVSVIRPAAAVTDADGVRFRSWS